MVGVSTIISLILQHSVCGGLSWDIIREIMEVNLYLYLLLGHNLLRGIKRLCICSSAHIGITIAN